MHDYVYYVLEKLTMFLAMEKKHEVKNVEQGNLSQHDWFWKWIKGANADCRLRGTLNGNNYQKR